MTETENLRELNSVQKELIELLTEGARKDAKIINLYKELTERQQKSIEGMESALDSTQELLKKLIP